MTDIWYWDDAADWAVCELYRSYIPANIKTYGELESLLITAVETEPEGSLYHAAARDVLEHPGAVNSLAHLLRIKTEK